MKRHLRAGLLAIPVLAGSLSAQTVVPITSEPDHHLVISNDYVRVFKVEVPPKAETQYHQHDYDYIYVAIGDADVSSTRLHAKTVDVKLKDGEVELSKAPFAHKATNNSDQPFRNVTIEILRGIGTPICGLAGGDKSCGRPSPWEGVTHRNGRDFSITNEHLLKSSTLDATRATLRGSADMDLGQGPCLLVAVSEVRLKGTSQKSTRDIFAKSGEVVWIDEPNLKILSLSPSAKFIIFGFSPAKMQ